MGLANTVEAEGKITITTKLLLIVMGCVLFLFFSIAAWGVGTFFSAVMKSIAELEKSSGKQTEQLIRIDETLKNTLGDKLAAIDARISVNQKSSDEISESVRRVWDGLREERKRIDIIEEKLK